MWACPALAMLAGMRTVLRLSCLVLMVPFLSPVDPALGHSLCVLDGGRCRGCGCKGGPGYRAPNGRCVSFKRLEKVCGAYPHRRCAFENAPGTGANRACATHEHPRKRKRK